MLLEPLVK